MTEWRRLRLKRLKARRHWWLQVHLYLGLVVGAVLVVVGTTGSILIFYEELQEIFNTEQIVTQPPMSNSIAIMQPLDVIIAAAEQVKPAGSQFFKLYYPRHSGVAYKLLYFVSPLSAGNDSGDGYYVFVNPYTAQATGVQLWHPFDNHWRRPLMSFIMQLHYCLLLDPPGLQIVGLLAVLMIISVLTGLIVWWPLNGKFHQALSIKRRAGPVRFNIDLHKISGIYFAPVLLVVLFSGVYFNLPEQINTLVRLFSELQRPNAWEGIESTGLFSKEAQGRSSISPGKAESIIRQHYPGGRLWMLNAPQHSDDVYRIAIRDDPAISALALGYREFAVDQYSGDILKVYNADSGRAGDVFLDWQWPLHSGQAFGWPGRILVFLAGLACPVLYVTGVIRWLQKRRAAKQHKIKFRSN